MNNKYFLILDIGGTKTSSALFTEDGVIKDDYVHVVKSQTFKGEEAVYQNTKKALEHIIDKFSVNMEDVIGIGIGSPGPLDVNAGVIIHAPLMGWKNFPIVKRIKEDFNKETVLDNDANLGALAEHRLGVAKGFRNILYMTVSTGCGGGIIIDNKLYRGKNDGAGEFGHMSIDYNGLDCKCGSKGCFEMYASGTAMNNRMKNDMLNGRKSYAFEMADYNPENLKIEFLNEAFLKNDDYAREFYKLEGYYLGVGIANLFNLYDPDVIVLGGGVTKSKEFFHDEMIKTIKKLSVQQFKEEQIKYSIINDRIVLYGAYCLIKEKFNN